MCKLQGIDTRSRFRLNSYGVGNYNMGIQDVSVFTEVDADKLKYPLGVNIAIVTTATNDEGARELLKMMEVPFAE